MPLITLQACLQTTIARSLNTQRKSHTTQHQPRPLMKKAGLARLVLSDTPSTVVPCSATGLACFGFVRCSPPDQLPSKQRPRGVRQLRLVFETCCWMQCSLTIDKGSNVPTRHVTSPILQRKVFLCPLLRVNDYDVVRSQSETSKLHR